MSGESSTLLKPPAFDGKRENYPMWETKYRAFAALKGFLVALQQTHEGRLPESEETELDVNNPVQKAQEKARHQNHLAVSAYTMAFTNNQLVDMIYESANDEYPGGRAYLIAKALKKKYKPSDLMTVTEKKVDLAKIVLKPKDHPGELFEKLSAVRNKYRDATDAKMMEGEMQALVIEKAPPMYLQALNMERRIRGEECTLLHLQEAMEMLWRTTQGMKPNDEVKPSVAQLGLAAFSGVCYHCGDKGHMAKDCENDDGNSKKDGSTTSSKRFKGKCNNCGIWGHMSKNCFEHARNAHLRPQGWKPRNKEVGASAIEMNHEMDVDEVFAHQEFMVGLAAVDAQVGQGHEDGYEEGEEVEFDNSTVESSEYEEVETGLFTDSETEDDEPKVIIANLDEIASESEEEDEYEHKELALATIASTASLTTAVLKGPDLWIADTGATTHMTPHKEGFIHKKQGSELVVTASGSEETAVLFGNISGYKVTKWNKPEMKMFIKNVTHTPNGMFNLFSIGVMIEQGWTLFGNKDKIWLQKKWKANCI